MSHLSALSAPRAAASLLAAVAALSAVALLLDGATLSVLQELTGYDSDATTFGKLRTYLSNLQKALIPLAPPVGGIGLVAGGAMYLVGNQMATKVLVGVGIGLGVILLAPSIIQ